MRRDAHSPAGVLYTYLFGLVGWAVLLDYLFLPMVIWLIAFG